MHLTVGELKQYLTEHSDDTRVVICIDNDSRECAHVAKILRGAIKDKPMFPDIDVIYFIDIPWWEYGFESKEDFIKEKNNTTPCVVLFMPDYT